MTKVWKNAEWRVSGEGSEENTNWVNPVDLCQLGTVDQNTSVMRDKVEAAILVLV